MHTRLQILGHAEALYEMNGNFLNANYVILALHSKQLKSSKIFCGMLPFQYQNQPILLSQNITFSRSLFVHQRTCCINFSSMLHVVLLHSTVSAENFVQNGQQHFSNQHNSQNTVGEHSLFNK